MTRIIGLDLGCTIHGISVICDNRIEYAANVNSDLLWTILTNFMLKGTKAIVIEDLAPYTGVLSPQLIDTAKFIGMAAYKIQSGFSGELVMKPRSEVKKWVFDNHYDLVYPLCKAKLDKAYAKKHDNAMTDRKPSFVYVDDRMVQLAMMRQYGINAPKAGKGYEYGLKEHSWQALAVATVYNEKSPA